MLLSGPRKTVGFASSPREVGRKPSPHWCGDFRIGNIQTKEFENKLCSCLGCIMGRSGLFQNKNRVSNSAKMGGIF